MLRLIVLAVLLISSPAQAAGNESRCTELGANCVCSEPMNTNSWTVFNSSWWDPGDTLVTDKECNVSGLARQFLEDGSGFRYEAVNSGDAINALPAGHAVTYVLKTLEGGGGGFAGGKLQSANGVPTARRAVRWYIYYSPNFVWGNGGLDTGGGTCNNSSKLLQLGHTGAGTGGPLIWHHAGTWSFYDISTSLNWNQTATCCLSGPGTDPATPSGVTPYQNKWVRLEFIMHNSATTGASSWWEVYAKNITDNGPEYKVIDTSVSQTGTENTWDGTLLTNLHPTEELQDFVINMFRNNGSGGNCTGYLAFTHYLAAAWSTDAGQRIGAAVEVEGSGGGTGTGGGMDVRKIDERIDRAVVTKVKR